MKRIHQYSSPGLGGVSSQMSAGFGTIQLEKFVTSDGQNPLAGQSKEDVNDPSLVGQIVPHVVQSVVIIGQFVFLKNTFQVEG